MLGEEFLTGTTAASVSLRSQVWSARSAASDAAGAGAGGCQRLRTADGKSRYSKLSESKVREEESMAKFVIHSHGRLQEWVAEEKGYFRDEGLDYEFVVKPFSLWSATVKPAESAPSEVRRGAFEAYEEGKTCNVSAACHWTVNMAASAGHGRMWADAYSVCSAGIYVSPESRIRKPDDLANIEIIVGYHSGSHFSTLQAVSRLLPPEQIKLRFVGMPLDRLALLIDRQVEAGHMFGAPLYVAEQLGFRKIVDATFMMGYLITGNANADDVGRYFRAMRRAQRDIDVEPEIYTHYFLRELPERYHSLVDVRAFGPGERIVFEPCTRDVFERTHRWMEDWKLFPADQAGSAGYEESVLTATVRSRTMGQQ
jgi:NitT/TauT family transport system substrate-binding protein